MFICRETCKKKIVERCKLEIKRRDRKRYMRVRNVTRAVDTVKNEEIDMSISGSHMYVARRAEEVSARILSERMKKD